MNVLEVIFSDFKDATYTFANLNKFCDTTDPNVLLGSFKTKNKRDSNCWLHGITVNCR